MGYLSSQPGDGLTIGELIALEQLSDLGDPLQYLRVNAAGTGLEYSFIDLQEVTNNGAITDKEITTNGIITPFVTATDDLIINTGVDKTVVLNESVYDDLPPASFSNATIPPANAPTYSVFSGNFKQYQFDIGDYLFLQPIEVTHSYKEGTDFSVHIHWATGGSDVDARYVKWEVEYLIADGYEIFTGTTISSEVEIPAGTSALTHLISNIDVITGTNFKIGAYILCIVKRITSTGTAPTADPFGLALGVHVEQDTIGSRQLFIK